MRTTGHTLHDIVRHWDLAASFQSTRVQGNPMNDTGWSDMANYQEKSPLPVVFSLNTNWFIIMVMSRSCFYNTLTYFIRQTIVPFNLVLTLVVWLLRHTISGNVYIVNIPDISANINSTVKATTSPEPIFYQLFSIFWISFSSRN